MKARAPRRRVLSLRSVLEAALTAPCVQSAPSPAGEPNGSGQACHLCPKVSSHPLASAQLASAVCAPMGPWSAGEAPKSLKARIFRSAETSFIRAEYEQTESWSAGEAMTRDRPHPQPAPLTLFPLESTTVAAFVSMARLPAGAMTTAEPHRPPARSPHWLPRTAACAESVHTVPWSVGVICRSMNSLPRPGPSSPSTSVVSTAAESGLVEVSSAGAIAVKGSSRRRPANSDQSALKGFSSPMPAEFAPTAR